jgi:hypothetical protein
MRKPEIFSLAGLICEQVNSAAKVFCINLLASQNATSKETGRKEHGGRLKEQGC